MKIVAAIWLGVMTMMANTASAQEHLSTYSQTLFIAKPAEQVWNALTDKTLVDQYYMGPLGVSPLAAGGEIYYGRPDNKMIYGKVLTLESPKVFSHTFTFANRPERESVVIYTIEPIGEMSALHLRHEFASDPEGIADVRGGWPIILSGLKTLLETGKPLPWPKKQ